MVRNLSGRLVTGLLIVIVGVLLLLGTTGVTPTDSLWDWFPLVFVVIGIWALVTSGFRNLTGPVMVIAVAGTFLLRNLELITREELATWWPLFIVLFGVLIIVNRTRRNRRVKVVGDEDEKEITAVSVFSGDERRLTTESFTGAELVAVFGDVRLDLRDVSVPVPPAVVEIVCVFGDIEIRIPEDWDVRRDVLVVFGDVSDKRPLNKKESGGTGTEDGKDGTRKHELAVTGLVLFGDIEIRD
jgi:predicted membrane protein